MGHGQVVDSMINDGLWCTFENWHMGNAGEVVATECGIARQAQDAYALESHRKAAAATDAGRFGAEILPVTIPAEEGRPRSRLRRTTNRFAATRRSRRSPRCVRRSRRTAP